MRHAWWIAVAVACGPSSAEIRTARTATYSAEPAQILELAIAAAAENYKIGQVDKERLAFVTQPRTYNREGGLESQGAEGVVRFRDRSVSVRFIVQVTATADHRVSVTVTPHTLQLLAGSPQPRELAADDPALPGFVLGRTDALVHAIYRRAKAFSVATP